MTTKTKTLVVRGVTYTIKRFGLKEGAFVDGLIEAAKDLERKQAISVFYGTVKPKFESVEAIEEGDREIGLHLWIEINRFNRYETSFLSLLKNSPSQVLPQEETKKQ
jgi:uncharacterized protein YegJ (DUF2314 family)